MKLVRSILGYWHYDRESVEVMWPDARCFPLETAEQRQVVMDLLMSDKSLRFLYLYGPPESVLPGGPHGEALNLWNGGANGSFAILPVEKEAWEVLDRVTVRSAGSLPADLPVETWLADVLRPMTTDDFFRETQTAMRNVDDLYVGVVP